MILIKNDAGVLSLAGSAVLALHWQNSLQSKIHASVSNPQQSTVRSVNLTSANTSVLTSSDTHSVVTGLTNLALNTSQGNH
jgi:hypothetical protein